MVKLGDSNRRAVNQFRLQDQRCRVVEREFKKRIRIYPELVQELVTCRVEF